MKGKDSFESAAALLPRDIRGGVLALRDAERAAAEEIRLRCGHPPAVLMPGGDYFGKRKPDGTVRAALKKGGLTMAELRRNAEEVLSFALHSSAEMKEV